MNYNFSPDREIFSGLHDVCSGNAPNKIFAIAKIFQRPEPLDGLVSLLVEIEINDEILNFEKIFDGYENFTDYYSNFNCIGRGPDGQIYVGEDDGFIVLKDGRSNFISLRSSPPPHGLQYSIYVRGVGRLVFGTSAGSIIHVDGNSFASHFLVPHEIRRSAFFTAIHGIGSEFMVAVGDGGVIAKYSDGQWKKIPCPTNDDLLAVFCKEPNDVFIGTRSGRVWRWDGDGRFAEVAIDDQGESFAICDFEEYQGNLYGAFGNSGIYCLGDEGFFQVPETKGVIIGKIKSTNMGLIGLGAGWGPYCNWFARFDGKKWNSQRLRIPF
jgi:hypothetical protein